MSETYIGPTPPDKEIKKLRRKHKNDLRRPEKEHQERWNKARVAGTGLDWGVKKEDALMVKPKKTETRQVDLNGQ